MIRESVLNLSVLSKRTPDFFIQKKKTRKARQDTFTPVTVTQNKRSVYKKDSGDQAAVYH